MLWWFTQNALIAVVLAAIVWSLCRIRRLGPAVRHALWLVVLLKLVTPPLLTWPWPAPSVFEWLQPASVGRKLEPVLSGDVTGGIVPDNTFPEPDPRSVIPTEAIDHFLSLRESSQVDESDSAGFSVAATNANERTTFRMAPGADTAAPVLSPRRATQGVSTADRGLIQAARRIASLVAACWMLGAVVSFLIYAIQIARFLRLVAGAEGTPESLLRQVKHVAATLRVRPPQVLLVPGIRSPVIWGGVRAQLFWPACLGTQARRTSESHGAASLGSPGGLADSPRWHVGLVWDFESGRWDGVIAHELAHLRRRDHWVGWLELVAGCVWWWNPLFWYVRHQLRENAELACDALVVWALPDGRRTYAESLIEVVSHFSPVATPAPVLGVNSVARQAFERRLTMILSERVPWKLSVRGLLAIGLLALVALPGWSLAQVATTPTSQEPPTKEDAKAPPVVYVETPVLVTAADLLAGQAPSDDSRMDALEKKLEALIAEVKAMRARRTANAAHNVGAAQQNDERRANAELTAERARLHVARGGHAGADDDNLKNTLWALEQRRYEAAAKGDWEAGEKFLADDFISMSSRHGRNDKAAIVEALKLYRHVDGRFRNVEVRRVSKDVAVLTYVYDCEVHSKEGELLETCRDHWASLVWAQRNGSWVIVFCQETILPGGE